MESVGEMFVRRTLFIMAIEALAMALLWLLVGVALSTSGIAVATAASG